MDELNHLGWVVYKSYRFAHHVLGIRTNSEATGEWLNETFSAYELKDEEVDPYYSLYMADDEDEGVGQRFHILYRESINLFRSLDPAAVARRLVADLDLLPLKSRDDGLYLNASVVGYNGVNALVPSPIIPYIRLNGRKVERELALPDVPALAVDADSGRLVPIPQQLDVPESAFDDLRRRIGANGAAATLRPAFPESVEIVCLFHYDPQSPPIMPLTRALAVYYLARNAVNLRQLGGEALTAIAKTVEGARCYLLQEARSDEAYKLLKAVLAGEEDAVMAAATG